MGVCAGWGQVALVAAYTEGLWRGVEEHWMRELTVLLNKWHQRRTGQTSISSLLWSETCDWRHCHIVVDSFYLVIDYWL